MKLLAITLAIIFVIISSYTIKCVSNDILDAQEEQYKLKSRIIDLEEYRELHEAILIDLQEALGEPALLITVDATTNARQFESMIEYFGDVADNFAR